MLKRNRPPFDLIFVVFFAISFAGFDISTSFYNRLHDFLISSLRPSTVSFLTHVAFLLLIGLLWITYRRWQEELGQKKELERIISAISPDVLLVVDPEKNILMCNQSLPGMFGYDIDEVIGRKTEFLYLELHTEAGELAGMHETLQSQGFNIGLAMGKKESGEKVPLEIVRGKLRGGHGSVLLLRDITARRRAEEEKAKLELRIRQSQKMEAVGALAGGIAHDFNNILSAMIGFTELTLLDAEHGSPLWRNLEEVLQAGKRARELVRQILSFSRQTEQEQKPSQVSLIVEEVLKFMRASLPATIEIRQNLQARSVLVLADPTGLHQVLMNLCANAEYSMREKGGVLEVSLTEEEVDSTSGDLYPDLVPGSFVKLTVRDTGHGMDKVIKERIFEPFFTTKAPGEGTGMGLSVVHGIVKKHGGTTKVLSEPGKGTEFQVLLPRLESQWTPDIEADKSLLTGKGRILFIDDEVPIVNFACQMLKRLGYEVMGRTNGVEALAAFRSHPDRFDLVITDMSMPHMTGIGLAREFLKIRPEIAIILCTGFPESIDSKKTSTMGIRKLLMKPLVLGELNDAIREVLDGKEMEEASSNRALCA